jgi:ATP-binding cassette subfamily B protein
MIAKHYGKIYSLEFLRNKSFITREGVSLLGISDAAESIGFRTIGAKATYEQLKKEATLPAIAHWMQNHFIVIYKIKKDKIYVADPAHGLLTYGKDEFLKGWIGTGENEGILLLLEPTPHFYQKDDEAPKSKRGFRFLFSYLFPYRKFITQLLIGMVAGSLLQLIFPFLTQSLVDFGISNQNIGFIYTILAAQLMLFLSRTTVDLIRGWILLHIGTRVNISIISDFLIKLMKLPLSFFDTKFIGDILQRIGDHRRVENFLTSSTLGLLFSMVNLIIFSIVMAVYSLKILLVFVVGSVLVIGWVLIFMKKRSELDYKRFRQLSQNQSNLIQLIQGMPEIKLNNSEKTKRWEWERIQAGLFKINMKGLAINQYQQAGSLFLNELKNILITFLVAREVILGHMTLGMMLAISYILGQMNSPIDQLMGFFQTAQDAKLSLERLEEIHLHKEEEDPDIDKITIMPSDRSLSVNNLGFQYEGPQSEFVLKDLNLSIPQGKVTAIVGPSGSGKTTLMKLLLKFYEPTEGEIRLGDINLSGFNTSLWRQKCGVVMQDGYLFSDTIAKNIVMSDESIHREKLLNAVKVANIQDFIETLPLSYTTKVGQDGHGLSQGQKQRLLIARAVYKDPDYLLFDEATSSLDANNESVIIKHLEEFFKGKTVVIIAHRLSTVQKADQIVVLDQGHILEQGTHLQLVKNRGSYYNLIKNQLELGL